MKQFENMSAFDDTPLAREIATNSRRLGAITAAEIKRPANTRIFTISNQKGGVGKTTTAVNLAASLAYKGLNVLVIDLDPQGNASTALGVDHHSGVKGIYEVLTEGASLLSVIAKSPVLDHLYCVPASIDLAGAELELVSVVARETRLKNALDTYINTSITPPDYVFIDCPPSLGLLTVNAFVAATEVLIPIQCEYYALEGLSQLRKNIGLIKQYLNPALEISTILLTMYDSRTRLAADVAADVRSHFADITLNTVIPRSVKVSEAPSYQKTIITYDANSSGAISYHEAAAEIAIKGEANGR
mgnify:CR=1 FL=1